MARQAKQNLARTPGRRGARVLPKQLQWAREIQAIAQTGLSYARDPHDVERYAQLRAIAARMMAADDGAVATRLESLFVDQAGHATPKVDVRAAVFRDDTILLVQGTDDGAWSLPGGWADPGESPSEAATRETFEESGFQIKVNRLLAVYDRDRHGHPPLAFHVYKLFFDGQVISGSPAGSLETSAAQFFDEHRLPPLSLTRNLPGQIARLFELHRNLSLPADFD